MQGGKRYLQLVPADAQGLAELRADPVVAAQIGIDPDKVQTRRHGQANRQSEADDLQHF